MTDRDYLWCALNLLLDGEEELDALCPACPPEEYLNGNGQAYRSASFLQVYGRAGTPCPVCGAAAGGGRTGENAGFDPERFERMRRGETA